MYLFIKQIEFALSMLLLQVIVDFFLNLIWEANDL